MAQCGTRQVVVLFIAYWQDPLMPDRERKVIPPRYPQTYAMPITMHPYLHPLLQKLPEKHKSVNREQDLETEGMRKAKLSYKPVGFVKKDRAVKSRGR